MISLIPPAPPVVVGAAAGLMFGGIQLGNALWDAMLQQHIPRDVFLAGLHAAGVHARRPGTLAAAAALSAAANLGVLCFPSVRNLPRLDVGEEAVGAEPESSAQPA